MKDKLKLKSKTSFEKFMDYAKDNIYVAGGFTGMDVVKANSIDGMIIYGTKIIDQEQANFYNPWDVTKKNLGPGPHFLTNKNSSLIFTWKKLANVELTTPRVGQKALAGKILPTLVIDYSYPDHL